MSFRNALLDDDTVAVDAGGPVAMMMGDSTVAVKGDFHDCYCCSESIFAVLHR